MLAKKEKRGRWNKEDTYRDPRKKIDEGRDGHIRREKKLKERKINSARAKGRDRERERERERGRERGKGEREGGREREKIMY